MLQNPLFSTHAESQHLEEACGLFLIEFLRGTPPTIPNRFHKISYNADQPNGKVRFEQISKQLSWNSRISRSDANEYRAVKSHIQILRTADILTRNGHGKRDPLGKYDIERSGAHKLGRKPDKRSGARESKLLRPSKSPAIRLSEEEKKSEREGRTGQASDGRAGPYDAKNRPAVFVC